jgi:hypothetical protein
VLTPSETPGSRGLQVLAETPADHLGGGATYGSARRATSLNRSSRTDPDRLGSIPEWRPPPALPASARLPRLISALHLLATWPSRLRGNSLLVEDSLHPADPRLGRRLSSADEVPEREPLAPIPRHGDVQPQGRGAGAEDERGAGLRQSATRATPVGHCRDRLVPDRRETPARLRGELLASSGKTAVRKASSGKKRRPSGRQARERQPSGKERGGSHVRRHVARGFQARRHEAVGHRLAGRQPDRQLARPSRPALVLWLLLWRAASHLG